MDLSRNMLYEIKKESLKRTSHNPIEPSELDDIRKYNQLLHCKLRAQDSSIIRLERDVAAFKEQIANMHKFNSSTQQQQMFNASTASNFNHHASSYGYAIPSLSSNAAQQSSYNDLPIVTENIRLAQTNRYLEAAMLAINAKNNELAIELRTAQSELRRMQTKVKELQILEEMREERFKDEVSKLTPIIVTQSQEPVGMQELLGCIDTLKGTAVEAVFRVFIASAKACQQDKKTSSFNIFKQLWQAYLANGEGLLGDSLRAVYSLQEVYQRQQSASADDGYERLLADTSRDTLNEWIISTLVDIRNCSAKEPEQKIFRLLGLLYRSKYPIQGQTNDIDPDVRRYFHQQICEYTALALNSLQ